MVKDSGLGSDLAFFGDDVYREEKSDGAVGSYCAEDETNERVLFSNITTFKLCSVN